MRLRPGQFQQTYLLSIDDGYNLALGNLFGGISGNETLTLARNQRDRQTLRPIYRLLPVVVSEARTPRSGREGESNHPENVSLTIPQQGVLPKQRHLLRAAFKEKWMERNSLKL
jgi:hypothetical protein